MSDIVSKMWLFFLGVATCGHIECHLLSTYKRSHLQIMICIAGMSTADWTALLVVCCCGDVVRILAMVVLIKCHHHNQ